MNAGPTFVLQSVTSEFVMIPRLLPPSGATSLSSSLNSSFTLPSMTHSQQQLVLTSVEYASVEDVALCDEALSVENLMHPQSPLQRPQSPPTRPRTALGSRSTMSVSSGSLHASDLSSSLNVLAMNARGRQPEAGAGTGLTGGPISVTSMTSSHGGQWSELSDSQSSISTHYGSLPILANITKRKRAPLPYDASQSLVNLLQSWESLQCQVRSSRSRQLVVCLTAGSVPACLFAVCALVFACCRLWRNILKHSVFILL